MLAQQLLQQRDFTMLRSFKKLLFDSRQRINSINFNGLRVVLHAAANRRDRFRPCGGKQQRLARSRRKADHFINGVAKPHIQHAVRFVHHRGL